MGRQYSEYPPPVRLRDHIDCFWSAHSDTGCTLRILPDGCMDIVASHLPQPCIRVVGTMTRHRVSALAPEGWRYGVRFRPAILPRLLKIDARVFVDASVEAQGEMRKRFASAETFGGFIRAVEDWLAAPPGLEPLQQAIGWAWSQERMLTVPEIANHAGLSERQFRRVALGLLGISPKQLTRVARFRRALREGRLHQERTWADIAADCDYYDQSHLIRDFSAFAGVAPDRFFQDTSLLSPLS